MASIRRRELPDGTARWDVRYRDGSGSQRTETFDKEKAARTRRAAVETELARAGGTWTPPTRLTFKEVAEAWYERKKASIAPATRIQYRSALDAHLLTPLGARLVVAIKPSDVQALRATMARDGKAANTIGQAVPVLRMVLGELVYDGRLPSNPVESLPRGKRPGRRPRKTVVPTHAQIDKLIAAAREDARPVLELAASTGMRRAELLRLTWADVDTAAREIHVRASKTEAGERVVPMFGSARRILLEQKARTRFKRPEHPVFATVVGSPHDPKAWHDREYVFARDAANLPTIRLHDFRHFAVSKLVEQGANVLLVSRIAGHSDPSMTLRVYSHLFSDGLAEAAVRFDPRRGKAVASGRR